MSAPPRVASLLLRLLLPRAIHEPVAGDLEEEWRRRPEGAARNLLFWRLTLASIAAWWWGARHRFARRTTRLSRTRLPRPARGDSRMQTFLHDLAHGLRLMARAPAFSAAVIVTIGLGIGANAAIFSMVRGLVLQPVPYADPERVAFVLGWDTERQDMRFSLSMADALDIARETRTLEQVAAYSYLSANLTGGPTPERVQAYRVTTNTFELLGVPPERGRTLAPEDGRPGAGDVAVIGYGLWDRLFGRDESVVGREVMLNDAPHTIVGVMPRRFEFPVFNFKGDIWTPYRVDEAAIATDRAEADSVVAIARLAHDASYADAQAEVDTIMSRLAADHPRTNRHVGVRLTAMQRLDDEQAGPLAVVIPFVAVGVVLLLACANVANLLLARGVARRRELAIRAALGAGRRRIVAQLLAESLVYATAGAVLGIVLAWWVLGALRRSLPDVLVQTSPNVTELGLDVTTLVFTAALTLVSGLLFGLLPALRASSPMLAGSLKEDARGGGRVNQRLRGTLVGAEVALSLMLLVAAGLLVRSFQQLQQTDPGFDPRGVLTLAVTLPEHRYADPVPVRQFFERALERIQALPAVRSAAFVNVLPFSTYDRGTTIVAEGQPAPEPGRELRTGYRVATPEYFTTLGIPLAVGRAFSPADRETGPMVAVINRTLAQRLFGDHNPVGQRLRLGPVERESPWRTIVGVVGDVQHAQLTGRPSPELYVPMAQEPQNMMMLAARAEGDPEALAGPARAAILAVDPTQPVFHVRTLSRLVDDAKLPNASAMSLMSLFGALALLLASVGLYSVVAYLVSQQTREFGVRMALGAEPRAVLRLVLWRGLRIVAAGAVVGLAGALAVTRLMAGMLVGISPGDPATYLAAFALLTVVSLVACAIPARRATRVDPVQALRAE